MATQALSMPTNAPTQALSPSNATGGHTDKIPFLSSQSTTNTKTGEDHGTSILTTMATSVVQGAMKDADLTKRRQSSMDRALLRKHKYENLTMLLNTPQALALLRSNASSEAATTRKPVDRYCAAPVCDRASPGQAETFFQPDAVRSEQQTLCLSPRFPPDGAAFYEISPPNSSVSSSPVTSSNSDLKSDGLVVNKSTTIVPLQSSCGSDVMCNTQTNGVKCTVAPSNTSRNYGSTSSNAFGRSSFGTGHGPNNSEQQNAKESLLIDAPCSAPSHTEDTNSASVTTADQQDWFPPAPPPPLQAVWGNTADSDACPRYHEHCRPGEERRFNGLEASRSNGGQITQNVISTHPASESSHANASNSTSSSGAIQAPSLPHLSRTLSSPTPPPLPPPPSPPSPPVVPKRDPRTTLHQPHKHVADSDVPAEVPVSQTMDSGGKHKTTISSNSFNSSPDTTVPSTGAVVQDSTSNDTTLINGAAANSNSTERTAPQSVHSPTAVSLPNSRPVTINLPSPTNKPVTRPIPIKGSPLTDVSVEYQRHNSLPANTTSILDGRSVVPWNPTSRDLFPVGASNSNSNVEAAVAAALTQSVIYSADSPQWVPPRQINPAAHDGVLNPTADYTDTVLAASTYRATQSPETGAHFDAISEMPALVQRSNAARPTCLIGIDPRTGDRLRQAGRRYMSENVHSEKAAEQHRRNRTASDRVDALQLLSEAGYPGYSNQSANNAIPVTEAEWWRAQQRSGLLAHGHSKTKDVSELFKRQVSAGPVFNLAPIGQTQLSPTRLLSSQTSHTRSRELVHPINQTQASPTEHARALMAQSKIRGQFNDEVVLVDSPHSGARFGYSPADVSLSPEHPQRFFSDPRFMSMDQSQLVSADRVHSTRLHESFELDHRDRMMHETSNGYHSSSMTQSVFFPSDSGWMASTHIPYEIKQTVAPPSSASGRRRRVRQGVMRSQSQRSTDQLDARHFTTGTVPELQQFCLSPSFYQRSISHTVPLEATGPETVWPQVMARWHRRRTTAGDPTVFASQLTDCGAAASRKDRALRAGRSSNDLIHLNRPKNSHPQHYHSSSAIFERLEEQPWFHFNLPRAGAERLLKSTPVGSFLVRQSETSKSEYSLSIRRECDFLHMKISQDPESNQYVLGEYSQPYPTVSAMIYRYMQSLLPVRGTTPVLLRFPVCRKSPKSPEGLD